MGKKPLVLLGMLLFVQIITFAQTRPISGKVSNENGEPLSGISITVKDLLVGTTTNAEGNYSLQVPSAGKVLVFTGVGFQAQEISIDNKSEINVVLINADKVEEEVVVVAYGTQSKKSFTGSASTIKAEILENRPVTSPEKALQGQATGITIQSASGQPGGASTVRIRGVGSLNASSEPLYVLDGVPIASGDFTQSAQTANILSTIDPKDIESITVLKDATAAGLYGSRAANGVVVITTKKGKAGRTIVNATANQGFSSIATKRHEVMTGLEYYKYYYDYYYRTRIAAGDAPAVASATANTSAHNILNIGISGRPDMFSDKQALDENGNLRAGVTQYFDTDWRDAVLRQGRTQDYNISLSGGNEKTRFYFGGGIFDQKGIVIASDFKRFSGKLNIETSAADFLKVGMNTTLAYTEQNTPPGAGGAANPVRFAEIAAGVYPLYALDANGQPIPDPSGNGYTYFYRTPVAQNYNPVGLAKKDIYNAKTVRAIVSPYLELAFTKNLSFKTQGTADYIDILETQYYNPVAGDGAAVGGRTYKFRPRDITLTVTNTLNYRNTFGDHKIDVLLGQEAMDNKYENIYAHGTTFPFDGIVELGSASTPVTTYSGITDRRLSSLFSRVNYDFNNKYFLSAGLRRDGSSVFGRDERNGIFWNVGAAWRISREDFMADVDWIDELKLKGSYGTSGNSNIGAYAHKGLYGTGYNYAGVPGMVYTQLENPNLKWEENAVMDLGIEAEFAKRFRAEFSYFTRWTNNALFAQPLSQLTGFTSITTNIANLKNSGFEAMLEATVIDNADFKWVSSINVTHTKNVIEKMNVDSLLNGSQIWRVGMDRYQWYLREWAGVDPLDGAPLWYYDNPATGKKETTKNYNAATRYHNGSSLPKFFGGFNNNFNYKGFDLSILTYFSVGGKIYDNALAQQMNGGSGPGNQLAKLALQAWQKEGDITNVPRFRPNNPDLGASASTRFLFDGSYFRVKNIALGYNIPKSFIGKYKLSNARIYVAAENFLTWASHKGMDPEVSIGGSANNDIPLIKTFSVGINLGL